MRTANKSTRSTAPLFLLPSLFVAQVLFFQSLYFQRWSWHEDRTPPLTVTKEWQPNQVYLPEIERGIAACGITQPPRRP